ncbi:Fungal specific transcription factor domain-containing protein [Cladophialophora immunda]|nr:Fungal specific transcription factor domain-containing protein [Cladophialophora immunda]
MSTGDRYQIKCDLSSLTTDRQCSNCRATNSSCYARQSRRRGAPHRLSTSSTGLPPSSVESPVIATPLDRPSYTPANPPESAIKDNDTGQIKAGQHFARTPRHDADERCDTIHTSSRLAALSEGHQGHRERAYLGQSGFMSMFDHPSRDDSDQGISPLITPNQPIPELSLILRQSYAETFVEYCYPWCPVVYRDDLLDDRSPFARSLLLQQAIGLLGTTINPPRLSHQARRVHYERFKVLFHSNMERNPLVRIVAIILIYWWSAGPPSVVSMDSQYWWTSIAIRLAQEIGLHREATPGQTLRLGETATLRRCIWWTLFAEVFICWVQVCEIIGDLSKHLRNRSDATGSTFELAQRLIKWVNALPQRLRLPFSAATTSYFDRHVHQLHLPYLSAITLLYMSASTQPLPKAYGAAVLSASCVARIFEDLLARGSVAFLPGVAGWYISIAILALLHARRIERLKAAANAQIDVLFLALREMSHLWHSSRMFLLGFEKLLAGLNPDTPTSPQVAGSQPAQALELNELDIADGIDYHDFFPGATPDTTQLFSVLFTHHPPSIFVEAEWTNDLSLQLQTMFGHPYDELDFGLAVNDL